MISLQDAAEYYEALGLWVVPNDVTDTFQDTIDAYHVQDISRYDWANSTSIKCVLAQKEVRAVVLHKFREKSERYNYQYLKRVLYKLGLKRYPWVIRTPDKFIIVVQSDNKPGQENIYTRPISLFLKGYLYLPFEDSSNQFYYNGIPTISPEHISIARLLRCFRELAEEMKWADYFSEIWSFNEFVKLHGQLSEIRIVHRNIDGSPFKLCVFDNHECQTCASLYSGIEHMTFEDILLNEDNLHVGHLLNKERFTVFGNWNGWENVYLQEDLDINKPIPIQWHNDLVLDIHTYYKLHGLWSDEDDLDKDTPEDEAEMDRLWEEQSRIKRQEEDIQRKKANEALAAKRRTEFLFDFSGDDSSLYPEFW